MSTTPLIKKPEVHHILIVDDNTAIHEDFRRILTTSHEDSTFDAEDAAFFGTEQEKENHMAFNLEFATQGQEALDMVRKSVGEGYRFSVVFMDVRMPPGWDGIETTKRLWEEDPDLQVVICTAYSDYSWDDMVDKLGRTDRLLILRKPFDVMEAEQAAHALSRKWELLQQSQLTKVFLEQTMDLSPMTIIWISEQGEVIYANQAAGVIFGQPAKRLISLTASAIFSTWHDDSWSTIWKRVTSQGSITQQTFLTTNDGTSVPVEAIITILNFQNQQVMCVSAQDITDRLETLRELASARDAALESARLKSQFLANMSHEIRTPMNGVLGMAELLAQSELNPTQREYVGIINQSGAALLSIINDILDSAKIESGKMELQHVAFDLTELIRSAMQTVKASAMKKHLNLWSHISPDVHTRLQGDPGRIRQILLNLIGNAVKFTNEGEVSVTIEQVAETDGNCTLLFTVKDTGIGIDTKQLEHIFKPFTQADSTTKRSYGGTGLGLTISSQLVQAMGGSIEASSHLGTGTRFSFTMTLDKADSTEPLAETNFPPVPNFDAAEVTATSPPDPTGKPPTNPLNILLAEDNEVNRKVTLMQLRQMGCDADIATNGREALKALENKAYDVVLMDCQMPVMDGYEATREIRKQFGHRIHIIALTANAMKEDRNRCINAGMDDYLSKPVDARSLAAALKLTPRAEGGSQPSTPAAIADAPPSPTDETPAVDLDRLREVTGDDQDLFREISHQYLEQADEILADLDRAIHEGDQDAVSKLAHKLAGSSATCGMTAVVPPLRSLERLKPDQTAQALTLFEQTQKQMMRVRQALTNPS